MIAGGRGAYEINTQARREGKMPLLPKDQLNTQLAANMLTSKKTGWELNLETKS